MSGGSIARRYARAVLSLGLDGGNLSALGSEVSSMAGLMKESAELRETLTNPVFPRDERKKIVAAILERGGASQNTKNLLALLVDRERINYLPDISRELSAMIAQQEQRVTAEVVSAAPLSAEQEQRLQAVLSKLSGKTVKLETSVDPALIGGVVAKVGDSVYDGSLKTQLKELGRQMAQ